MPQKWRKPEEIVVKLRHVDVLDSQGQSVSEAVRSIGVTQFRCCRGHKQLGGLMTDQVKLLKELETDRASCSPLVREPLARECLRKAVSGLTLDPRDEFCP